MNTLRLNVLYSESVTDLANDALYGKDFAQERAAEGLTTPPARNVEDIASHGSRAAERWWRESRSRAKKRAKSEAAMDVF